MDKKFGTIFVVNSGAVFSNTGFEKSSDTATFVKNLANWFTGGRPSKFYFDSGEDNSSYSTLIETITQAGHTWNTEYKDNELENVDVIFTSVSNDFPGDLLMNAFNRGISICIMPDYDPPESEEDQNVGAMDWNWSLLPFGLQYNNCYNRISGNQSINSNHPILAGVKSLYQVNGTSIIDFQPEESANQILVSRDKEGLYAIFDLAKASTRVRISRILSDGTVKATEADEYIVIKNDGLVKVDISGWRVQAVKSNKDFIFPAGTKIGKGGQIRVYTNEVHPESGDFSFGSKHSVWNNKADEGRLYDERGNLVSSYAYTEHSQKLANLMMSIYMPAYRENEEAPVLEADTAAIKAQKALGGNITFEEAIGLAYECFAYYNEKDGVGTAYETLDAQANAAGVPYPYFIDGEIFPSSWHYLQKTNTKITLCTPETPTLPTEGESIEANWIFMLKVPELNTVHWAIIDRTGENDPYNYGTKLS